MPLRNIKDVESQEKTGTYHASEGEMTAYDNVLMWTALAALVSARQTG